ncbi:MAG: hypothetical protein IJS08_05770 [Victivallales bacterium]|nr:hypothetical protein [Victivallales bacterium]
MAKPCYAEAIGKMAVVLGYVILLAFCVMPETPLLYFTIAFANVRNTHIM